MKKIKFISILLMMVLIISTGLSGCGSKEAKSVKTDEQKTTTEKKKQVVLKVWGDLPNQAVLEDPFKKINALFMEQNPNIKIDYDFAQDDQTLNVALQANELPDIFWVQGDKTPKMKQMVDNGFIRELDNLVTVDTQRYSDSEIRYGTIDGKLYSSLPCFLDTNLVYYNKDIFNSNNLNIPQTWDEFTEICDVLLEKDITPISLPGTEEWDRSWPIFVFAAAHGHNGLQGVMDGKGDLLQKDIMKFFNYYREFAEEGYFGKNFIATDMAGAQFAFTNGKAAMIIDGTWNNPTYEDSGMNLGRFTVPNEEGTRIVQSSFSNFMTYSISAKCQNPEEAGKYIQFLMSKEAQQIMEDANGLIPTISDIVPKNEGVKEMAQFDIAGWNIYSVLSSIATEGKNTPDVMMKEVIPKLMTSEITGEEAANILHESAEY